MFNKWFVLISYYEEREGERERERTIRHMDTHERSHIHRGFHIIIQALPEYILHINVQNKHTHEHGPYFQAVLWDQEMM